MSRSGAHWAERPTSRGPTLEGEPEPAPPDDEPARQEDGPPDAGAAMASVPHEGGTILVVDSDGVSRRFIELTLGRVGYQVESVADGTGALEILGTTPVRMVIAETDFVDMNGLQFYRRLTQESRLRGVPFIFLSADSRVATKVVALSAGVDGYLVKPCDGAELLAHVRSHIERRRRMTDAFRSRRYTLAGELSTISFPDLVSIIELARRSGRLSLVTAKRIGTVHFQRGEVIHAVFGNLSGPIAFHWMVAEEDGQFEFSPGLSDDDDIRRTIFASAAALIMESARVIDTNRASGTMPQAGAEEDSSPDDWRTPTTPDNRVQSRVQPFCPGQGVMAQLESAIADPYALGDLRLFTPDELAKWTRADIGRERFHVHLIADLAAGVSSILSLAGAPTERWILGSLTPEAKVAGLAFFLRHERLIDVLLIDIAQPRSMMGALERIPSLTIIAPPGGDFLTVGPTTRVELEGLLNALPPPALLAVGNSNEDGLQSFPSPHATEGVRRITPGALGEADCDLRTILVAGLRLATPGASAPAGRKRR
jgi:DNA-binding response OmpR family regulator